MAILPEDCRPMTNRVLIFEWLCGGGLWLDDSRPSNHPELVNQGQQMLSAICEDFSAAGWLVSTPVDSRLKLDLQAQQTPINSPRELDETFVQLGIDATYTLAIAPENDGRLARLVQRFDLLPGKKLNACSEFIELASNKNRMQAFLSQHGIDTPLGTPLESADAPTESAGPYQYVLKPSDACGGDDLKVVRSDVSPAEFFSMLPARCPDDWYPLRLEELVEGVAASISVIRTDDQTSILPPMRQVFKAGTVGKFSHVEPDLPDDLVPRANAIAQQVVEVLPPFRGFIGIDCVLGERDVAIEINPRPTMSYCVLRQMLPFNLAEKILGSTTNELERVQ